MPVIVLALDTSTPAVTAGVVRVRRPHELIAEAGTAVSEFLGERIVVDAFAHAEQLMPLTRAALADAGQTLRDVEAVVVGLGPGPFTGLRVGIATAAALGDALDLPVHGVPSHDGVAAAVGGGRPIAGGLLVVTDARRREVYASAYRDGRRRFGPAVLAAAALPAALADAEVEVEQLAGAGVALLTGIPELADLPVAASGALALGLVFPALPALLTGVVPGPLTPLYLRRPDAVEPAARRPAPPRG